MVVNVEFFVMNIDSPYNAILGRSWLGDMKAVASPFHQKLKFSSPRGVVVVKGKHEDARFYFNLALKGSLSEKLAQAKPTQTCVITEPRFEVCEVEKEKPSSSKREGKQIEQ